MYFDTTDNAIVEASLAQPDYKYKIRSRTYGDKSSGIVFFEIKAKLDGVVYKRRAQLTTEEYEMYLKTGVFPESQVMNEIDYIFINRQLMPKMYIAYDRVSYAARDDSDLRVTIDTNLRSRTHHLSLDTDAGCTQYFDEPTYIMEVKSAGGMPQWLVDALSTNKIFPSSFSKYGKIYQRNEQMARGHKNDESRGFVGSLNKGLSYA